MKVSIITVVYNNEKYIAGAIESVLEQDYSDIEYIIVDGASTDSTLSVISRYQNRITKIISEKDGGLYEAMNKGICAATGEVIGILNSDDFFYDKHVVSTIERSFIEDKVDAVIGDIVFIKKDDDSQIIRKCSSRNWKVSSFTWGLMPPHPSVFIKRGLFEKLGYYKTHYKIAADFELLMRFLLVNKINWKYLPVVTTKMRLGGKSTNYLKTAFSINTELIRSCRENKISTNYFKIYSRYFTKSMEFFRR